MGSSVGIAVFTSLPSSDDVKTCLREVLNPKQRALLQAALLVDTLHKAQQAGATYLVFSPVEAAQEAGSYCGVESFPQEGADLGERMARALERVLARGHDRALLVGVDCPSMSVDDLREASRQLREFDACLGPALNGGYYLIGLRYPQPRLFADVPWTTSGTLAITVDRLLELGMAYRFLRPLPDLDSPEDYLALVRAFCERGHVPGDCPRLYTLLRSWYSLPESGS